MGKYIFGTTVLLTVGFIYWIENVGFTRKAIYSPDGKFVIRIGDVGFFNARTLVRLSTKRGWPLYSQFYNWSERDGVPYAFEWFPDAVAMIDHFDFGTSVNVVALPSGKPLDFLSQRETEVREALRWKYAFTDFPKLMLENSDPTVHGTFRVYTNDSMKGTLNNEPVWFSYFAVLYKFDDPAGREETLLSTIALKAIGKACSNPDVYPSTKASFENQFFHAIRISCHAPRTETRE